MPTACLKIFAVISVVQLKGKHCRKPHCRNGVVDTFGHDDYRTVIEFLILYRSNLLLLFLKFLITQAYYPLYPCTCLLSLFTWSMFGENYLKSNWVHYKIPMVKNISTETLYARHQI